MRKSFWLLGNCGGRFLSSRLPRGLSIVGRSLACHLVLPDRTVSRRHAELIVGADSVALRDLGSFNGTHVDGNPVHSLILRDGRPLRFGAVELELSTSSSATIRSCRRATDRHL